MDLCNLCSKYPNFPFRVPHLQVQKESKKERKKGEREKEKYNFYVETVQDARRLSEYSF